MQMDIDTRIAFRPRASWTRAVSPATAGEAGTLAIVAAFNGFLWNERDATVYWVFARTI